METMIEVSAETARKLVLIRKIQSTMLIHANKTLTATQFYNLIDLDESKIQEVLDTVTQQLVRNGKDNRPGGDQTNSPGN
jgi:hypothetical protein